MRLPSLTTRPRLPVTAAVLAFLGFTVGALANQGIARLLALPEDADRFEFTEAGAPPIAAAEDGGPPPEPGLDEPPRPVASVSRPRGMTARQYADVIVRRNIFDSSAVYDPNAVVAGGGDCKSDASVRLLATVVADLPEYSSALISVGGKDGSADGYVVGDEVTGEGRILSIEQKKVCTDAGSCFCMGNDSALPGAASGGKPAAGDDEGGISKLSDTKFQVDSSVLENALGNVEALATQMRVVPHKGSDGQIDGYRVSSIRKNSLFDKLGIKNGDIVHGVNGQPLTSAEGALATYQALKNERSFSFEITRKSQRQTLEYEVR